ncbi:MAG TPA: hypothetical protein VGE52_19595, partial [Pirellulales bacterium]
SESLDWEFQEWSNFWGQMEQRSQLDALPWATMVSPPSDAPVARQTIERYRLRDPLAAQIGANFDSLPAMPKSDAAN